MSFIAISLGAAIRGAAHGCRTEYKKRHSADAIVMVERDSVWQAAGLIPRVERLHRWLGMWGW